MRLNDVVNKKGKYALVGRNSQGKTYSLNEFYKKHKSTTIFIENESKADEALKSSINSSPLVKWLERLLDLTKIQQVVNTQISSINIPNTFDNSNLDICFNNAVSNYKGLISAEVKTKSNQWGKPGSGETFLGELLLVEQMINQGRRNPIKYLIIDEPETFLHKSLYIKIISILQRLSQKMTIVVSTHSSDFLNLYIEDLKEVIIVREGELYPLKADMEYITKVKKLGIYDTQNSNMDRNTKKILNDYDNYFQYFVKPIIIKCLFNQVVVLGEGAAENALFECMRRYYSKEIFSGYTDYYALTGKYLMPAYIFVLKDMGINVVTLFDYDAKDIGNPWRESINQFIMEHSDQYIYFENEIEEAFGFGKIDRSEKGVKSPILIQLAFINKNKEMIDLIERMKVKIESVDDE